jgi:hypothetical protein
MIGNDSCGVHSVTAGTTVRNVEILDIAHLPWRADDGGRPFPGTGRDIRHA